MQNELSIQLTSDAFASLSDAAVSSGKTPAELAAKVVENAYGAGQISTGADAEQARRDFEQCIGSVDLGYPLDLDNDRIDADIAREIEFHGEK